MKQARSLVLTFAALVIIPGLILAANTVYSHYSEEKGLDERFGAEYLEYKKHVPMWLPRMTAFEAVGRRRARSGHEFAQWRLKI